MKIERDRRGVSPVVATVLLVVMVIVIGLIIFLWFRSFQQEAVTKFGGRNIALVCEDVQLLSSYSPTSQTLSISNIGNVPVYRVKLKITSGKSYETKNIEDLSDSWPTLTGLRQGGVFSDSVSELSGADEVLLIPVLIGTSAEGEKTHVCAEKDGQEVVL